LIQAKKTAMSNEAKDLLTREEQNQLLFEFYKNILAGNAKPSLENQKRFFLQLLNTKISQIEPRTRYIKYLHYSLRILIMLASGFTTVVLGLKLSGPLRTENVALIGSVIISFLSSLAVFWDVEHYWIRNKIMLNKLKEIRYEYVFNLSGNAHISHQTMIRFLNQFLSCLGDEYWEKLLKNARVDDPTGANENPAEPDVEQESKQAGT
jgi:hypothetical protein